MYYVAAEAAASGFMTMRQMISYPSEKWVTQFRCTDCDWVFHFQQPITADVSLNFSRGYARRWFATHSCRSRREASIWRTGTMCNPTKEIPGLKPDS